MTQAQMEDRETNRRISKAIQLDIEKRKIMNKPIAVYDKDTGEVYALYNDGKREVMGKVQLPMCCVHPLQHISTKMRLKNFYIVLIWKLWKFH